VSHHVFPSPRNEPWCLIIFVKKIILIDLKRNRIMFEIITNDILNVSVEDMRGILIASKPNKHGHNEFLIPVLEKTMLLGIYEKVLSVANF
jgi:hypothetical protein